MSIDDQNNHPLYKSAHDRFMRAEEQQNIKAAAKYPEPLNPASWSAEELGDHYAQESVDQGRYVEALVAKCKAYEEALKQALIDLKDIREKTSDWGTDVFSWEAAERISKVLGVEIEPWMKGG